MKALFSERSIEPLSERLAIFIVKWEFYFTRRKIGSRVPLYTLKLLLPNSNIGSYKNTLTFSTE